MVQGGDLSLPHDAQTTGGGPMVRVVDVHKRFGKVEVLRGVSFDVGRARRW